MKCVPLCNGREGTGPIVFGICSPVCWRCATAILTAVVLNQTDFHSFEQIWIVTSAGLLLTLIGACLGWRSHFSKVEVANIERVIGGAILGAGLWFVVHAAQI